MIDCVINGIIPKRKLICSVSKKLKKCKITGYRHLLIWSNAVVESTKYIY